MSDEERGASRREGGHRAPSPPPSGAIGHVEIPALDLGASRAFYSDVFGWRMREIPGMDRFVMFEDGGYGGALNGHATEPGAPVVPYVTVADIEATLARVTRAGGRVLQPKTDIGGGHGFVARLADPQGVVVGLWSRS